MKAWHNILVVLLSAGLIAGCGQSQASSHPKAKPTTSSGGSTSPTSSASKRILHVGTAKYQGSANLHKYESAASAHPHSYQAQLAAGTAANVNSHPHQAIQYWNRAIHLNPHQGQPYEYIGNIYLETYNNPHQALAWYKKAVTYGPSYDFGWYRVVQLEVHFGNMTAAKKYAAQAAKVLPANNKILKSLQTLVSSSS